MDFVEHHFLMLNIISHYGGLFLGCKIGLHHYNGVEPIKITAGVFPSLVIMSNNNNQKYLK